MYISQAKIRAWSGEVYVSSGVDMFNREWGDFWLVWACAWVYVWLAAGAPLNSTSAVLEPRGRSLGREVFQKHMRSGEGGLIDRSGERGLIGQLISKLLAIVPLQSCSAMLELRWRFSVFVCCFMCLFGIWLVHLFVAQVVWVGLGYIDPSCPLWPGPSEKAKCGCCCSTSIVLQRK